MCGIHGIVSLTPRYRPDVQAHTRMGAVTRHRGPDDEGVFHDERIVLGMRRLSIIDVAGGHQPIPNEQQTVWAVCNGEIYNYREVRAELQKLGHHFRTASDSEVIVHLYEEYGDLFVQHMDGMYGFALWDSDKGRLILGRDRLGIKPLYYRREADRLIFASEAKAILEVMRGPVDIDPDALAEYLTLGYVPCPLSIFEGIAKLPPASVMICEGGGCRIEGYWTLDQSETSECGFDELAAELLGLLEQSVVSQMVSDVPLGAFLSGGIDSSSVVALMARNSDQAVKTYSIGFGGSSGGAFYNELPYARQVADLFGTEHHEIIVEPDVASLLPRLLWHMDEPIADAAFVTTYLVAEFARRSVTVILSGVGGDELFGGYRRYLGEYFGRRYLRLPGWLRRRVLHPLAARLPSDRHTPLLNLSRYARGFILASELPLEDRYRSYVQIYDREKRERLMNLPGRVGNDDALNRAFSRASDGDELDRLLAVDLQTQLPDDLLLLTDKMSMATSLECRVPLLAHRLVEFSARLPSRARIRGGDLKHILKRSLHGLLPKDILYRKKRGFGAPMGAWLKNELAPLMRSVLSREAVESRGLLDWTAVAESMSLHASNRADYTDHLISLLNLELWCRIYLDGREPADLQDQLRMEAVG